MLILQRQYTLLCYIIIILYAQKRREDDALSHEHIILYCGQQKTYKLTNAVNTRVPVAVQLTRLHGVSVGHVAEFTLQLTAVVVERLQLCAIRICVFALWISRKRFTGYI